MNQITRGISTEFDRCRTRYRRNTTVLICLITLLTAANLFGQSDLIGVPINDDHLPAGAVKRYGSARFSDGGTITQLKYARNGKYLLSISGKRVFVRTMPDGQVIARFPAHESAPYVDISPDGFMFASVLPAQGKLNRTGGMIALFNLADGQLIRQLNVEGDFTYTAASFSADGKHIIGGVNNGRLDVINLTTGKVTSRLEPPAPERPTPNATRPSRDGKDTPRRVITKDSAPSKDGSSFGRPIGNQSSIRGSVADILHSSRHNLLITVHGHALQVGGSQFVIWDMQTRKPRHIGPFKNDFCKLAWSGGDQLSTHYASLPSQTWDLAQKTFPQETGPTNVSSSHRSKTHIFPSPDGKRFGIMVAKSESSKYTRTFYLTETTRTGGEFYSATSVYGAMAWSPDGKTLATSSDDGVIRLWDSNTRKLMNDVQFAEPLLSLALSPDGTRLATAGTRGDISVQPLAGGETNVLQGHQTGVMAMGFNPDGSTLASIGQDLTVRQWDMKTRQGKSSGKANRYQKAEPSPLAWTDDGRVIGYRVSGKLVVYDTVANQIVAQPLENVAAQLQRRVNLHDPTGTRKVEFKGDVLTIHRATDNGEILRLHPRGPIETGRTVLPFSQAGYSPDGKFIVAIQLLGMQRRGHAAETPLDAVIRVWNAKTGASVAKLTGHRGKINAMAFGPKGLLYTAGHDGSVLVWKLDGKMTSMLVKNDVPTLIKTILSDDLESAQDAMASAAREDRLTDEVYRAFLTEKRGDAEINQLLDDLASDVFLTRFKSLRTLTTTHAKTKLQWELQIFRFLLGVESADAAMRASKLLDKSTSSYRSSAQRRLLRLIKLLEWNGSKLAQSHLERIRSRLPALRGGESAAESLARIKGGTNRTDMPGQVTLAKLPDPVTPDVTPKPVTPKSVSPTTNPTATKSNLKVLVKPTPLPKLPKGAVAMFNHVPMSHGGKCRNVKLHPDGKRVISIGDDETARVWDLESGAELKRFPVGYGDDNIALSPDGQFLVIRRPLNHPRQSEVLRFDITTGKSTGEFPSMASQSTHFSPDGKFVVGSYTHVFEAQTGKARSKVVPASGFFSRVMGSIFTPNSKRLILFRPTSSAAPSVRAKASQITLSVWDLATEKILFESSAPHPTLASSREGDWLADARVSPDGQSVTTVFGHGMVMRWGLGRTGKPFVVDQTANYRKQNRYIRRAVIAPNFQTIFAAIGEPMHYKESNSSLIQLNAKTLQSLRSYGEGEDIHALDLSRDGKLLAAATGNGIALYDTQQGIRIGDQIGGSIVLSAISDDGSRLALGLIDGTVLVQNAADGSLVRRIPPPAIIRGWQIINVAFKPKSNAIVGASYGDSTVYEWDVQTGRSLTKLDKKTHSPDFHTYFALAPSWNKDGKFDIGGHPSWSAVATYSTNRFPECKSRDGRLRGWVNGIYLASPVKVRSSSPNSALIKFNYETIPENVRVVNGHVMSAEQVASRLTPRGNGFSHDNRLYALAVNTFRGRSTHWPRIDIPHFNVIYVWDVEKQKQVAYFEGHEGDITTIQFSPKSDRMYTTSFDGTVIVWKMP